MINILGLHLQFKDKSLIDFSFGTEIDNRSKEIV